MFVLGLPGLAPLLRRELSAISGVRITDNGNDGRADVLLCDVRPGQESKLAGLRGAEDVFVEIGRTLRTEGDKPHWIAGRVCKANRITKGYELWKSARSGGRRGKGGTSYRVVTRVLQERSFRRTELRRALSDAVGKAQPRWRVADPADLEVWALEYSRGKFVAGVRVSRAEMRQHGGREVERSGALRPTVAAAMVGLAGDSYGKLLDPCCGSGTILAEARAAGWAVEGRDIDRSAVRVANANLPGITIRAGDVRALDLPDGSVDACVSNLPFGQQYEVEGDVESWFTDTLAELARVTKSGGRVVLLVPDLPRSARPRELRVVDRYPLRLLGTATTIWRLDRR